MGKHTSLEENSADQRTIIMSIAKYLTYCKYEKGLAAKTQKAYKTDLFQFVDYISAKEGNLSKENLQACLSELHRRYKIKSVKRKIASLRSFLDYLEYEDILPDNPLNHMRIKLH